MRLPLRRGRTRGQDGRGERALKPEVSARGGGVRRPLAHPDPRTVEPPGGARQCGGCSTRFFPRSGVRSQEAEGPALPGRQPCLSPHGRQPRLSGALSLRRGERRRACAARVGVYLHRAPASPSSPPARRRSPDKDTAGGSRAARGALPLASLLLSPHAEQGRRCVAAAGQGLRRPPSLLCGGAVRVWVSDGDGKGYSVLGAGGRGGPLADAKTWTTTVCPDFLKEIVPPVSSAP